MLLLLVFYCWWMSSGPVCTRPLTCIPGWGWSSNLPERPESWTGHPCPPGQRHRWTAETDWSVVAFVCLTGDSSQSQYLRFWWCRLERTMPTARPEWNWTAWESSAERASGKPACRAERTWTRASFCHITRTGTSRDRARLAQERAMALAVFSPEYDRWGRAQQKHRYSSLQPLQQMKRTFYNFFHMKVCGLYIHTYTITPQNSHNVPYQLFVGCILKGSMANLNNR